MELPALMCRYADRFAALGRGEHHVGSPLGAWLVLALAAPAVTGDLADRVVDALGADLDTAHRMAVELLAHPHPAVSAAATAWTQHGLAGLDSWLATLPADVQTGPVPTQYQADAWAREHTLGLIDRFPLDTGGVQVLLASALATRVSWATPFETTDATDLRGPWSTSLTRVLRAPRAGGHHAFITDTERASLLAVHTALADGLEVTSVIAGPAVAPPDVLAAAHKIAVARAQQRRHLTWVSLFDLPLGEHPPWTITEEHVPEQGEQVDALLPAWHAASKHDLLTEPTLAFGAAGQGLQQLADLTGPIEAVQSAVARYSRRGFEAAAVTGLGVAISAKIPEPPGPHRTATIRFAHPYAVVATALGSTPADPWRGLPVFAAWITDPDDAQDCPDHRRRAAPRGPDRRSTIPYRQALIATV